MPVGDLGISCRGTMFSLRAAIIPSSPRSANGVIGKFREIQQEKMLRREHTGASADMKRASME